MKYQHSYISNTKLIKIILVTLSSILFLDISIGFLLNKHFKNSYVNYKNIISKQDIELLVLGSSTIARALNPKILEENTGFKSYSLAKDGTGLFYSTSIIRNIPKNNNLKYVILGIDPIHFSSGYNSNSFKQIKRLAPFANEDKLLNDYLKILDKNFSFKNLFFTYKYKDFYKSKIKENLYFHKNSKYNFFPLMGSKINYKLQPQININDSILETANEVKELLFDLSISLKKYNFKLILVTAPEYKTQQRTIQKRFVDIINEISNALKENNICDLSKLNNFDIRSIVDEPKLFYDFSHLNIDGANKFTNIIANKILNKCIL